MRISLVNILMALIMFLVAGFYTVIILETVMIPHHVAALSAHGITMHIPTAFLILMGIVIMFFSSNVEHREHHNTEYD